MPDYKEMYLTMMRAAETANRALIAAQQACEALVLAEEPPVLRLRRGAEKAGDTEER